MLEDLKHQWTLEQQRLRVQILERDHLNWQLPPATAGEHHAVPTLPTPDAPSPSDPACKPYLRLVGGVDISFFPAAAPADPSPSNTPSSHTTATHSSASTPPAPEPCTPAAVASAENALSSGPADSGGTSVQLPPEVSHPCSDSGCAAASPSEPGVTSPTEHGIAALVVLTYPELEVVGVSGAVALQELEVVYEDYQPLPLSVPYVPGFLAFREVPAYLALLQRVREHQAGRYTPQVLLVDGCGVLHPTGCGSASHLGVLADIPTVGVAKNILAVDGLDRQSVEAQLMHLTQATRPTPPLQDTSGTAALHQPPEPQALASSTTTTHQPLGLAACAAVDPLQTHHPPRAQPITAGLAPGFVSVPLVGRSGRSWGAALTTATSKKPLYVSTGHRVSLDTALELVSHCCRHRIPEPIRQADLRSRQAVRAAGCSTI